MMGNPIKKVNKKIDGSVSSIIFTWQDKDSTLKLINEKVVCVSGEKIPVAIYKNHSKQFYKILKTKPYLPKDRITLHNKNKNESSRLGALFSVRCYPAADGSITILRNKGDEIIPQRYGSFSKAISAQEIIINKYFGNNNFLGELNKLHDVYGITEEVRTLFKDWRESDDKKRDVLRNKLLTIYNVLSRCTDGYKINVTNQIKNIIKMKDSLDRNNPGAMTSRATCAQNNIDKRKVIAIRSANKSALRRHILIMEEKHTRANILFSTFILSTMLLSNDNLFKNPETVRKLINRAFRLLNSVWINPYHDKIIESWNFLEKAKDCADKNNPHGAKNFVVAANALLKEILI